MAIRTSRISKSYPIPEDVKPARNWGEQFSKEHGFAVKVHNKYWMSIFVTRELDEPRAAAQRRALANPGIVAHCISCVGETWDVHSEPTDKSTAGLIVYTAKGKALAAGEMWVDRFGKAKFSLATLYPGITNAVTIDYKVEGERTSDGGWKVTGSVTVSDSRA